MEQHLFLLILLTSGLVAKINNPEDTTNTDIWMIIFEVKKLTSIAIKAPTPNQKTKKPTVIISQIKNIPDAINHICHIKTSILAEKLL